MRHPSYIPRKKTVPRRIDDDNYSGDHQDSVNDLYRANFNETLDTVANQTEVRFNQNDLKPLENIESLFLEKMDRLERFDKISVIREMYPIISEKLDCQLVMFLDFVFNDAELAVKLYCMDGFVSYFVTKKLQPVFPDVGRILQIYLVAPISSATAERSFSTLRRTKTWLRSTQDQKRLTSLASMQIEKELLNSLDLKDIATQFASNANRRMMFF